MNKNNYTVLISKERETLQNATNFDHKYSTLKKI